MKPQVRGAKLLLTAGVTLTLAISMLSTGRTANASHIPTVGLGTAASFAILAGSLISDVPTSVITGDVGLSPATGAGLGLICTQVTGTIYSVDAAGPLPCRVTNPGLLTIAKGALTTAILDAAGRGGGIAVNPNPLTPNELAAQTLPHGIYKSTVAAMSLALGGTLTLNGGPNDVFIFQVPSLLTIGNGSTVSLTGGAQACNVFWEVADATIGTTANFVGTILASNGITVQNGSTIQGRLLAGITAVTLINDTITRSTCASGGGPAFPPPAIPTVPPTATPAPTATASPSAAPATATPKPSVASLPSTATLDDGALFVILPLLVIAFAVLYMVARARRRAARQVLTAPPAPVVPRTP